MSMFDKFKNFIGIEEDEDDYDYIDEPDFESEKELKETKDFTRTGINTDNVQKKGNIVNMQNTYNSNRIKISIHEPVTYEDAPKLLDDIISKRAAVLNLEMLDADRKRQIFDFVSGGIYSLDGRIQKITKDIFLIVPKGIEVDGKVTDEVQTRGFYQL